MCNEKDGQATYPRSATALCNLSYRLFFMCAADAAVAPALLGPASHSVYSCAARGLGFSGTGLSGPATANQTKVHHPNQTAKERHHLQSSSIWSPVTVTLPEPTSPPSQVRQSAGPRLTGAGAGGASWCAPSSRSVRETSGMWHPRRVLKSESRRKDFAGDRGSMPAVEVTERTGLVAALVDEGVGEATRAVGVGEVLAGSRRGTRVRKSPVESTDGGLSSEISAKDHLNRVYSHRRGSGQW
jgi:hypothetical protein